MKLLSTILIVGLMFVSVYAQRVLTEDDYYKVTTLPIPEGVVLEVGGLAVMPDGQLAVATRRGEVWLVENPAMAGEGRPYFRRFAHGLHEALGLAYHDGALYAAQRSELTRLVDRNGDGRADRYETVYTWPLNGNYHEYSYGPLFRDDGTMLVALNLAWVGYGASLSPWRGWTLAIAPDGAMTPIASGMRSPAGFGFNTDGALFYAENQGDWIGSGYITHVETGDFVGNPAGLRWTNLSGSPLKLKPEDIPDTGQPLFEVAKAIPALKPPAVWFPHAILGISTSDILVDTTGGTFGPFSGQMLVGDQGHSKIARVFLEKIDGVYQGAAFPFREGFSSGVLRMVWGTDGALFVGMTNRGWASTGKAPYGLQRLMWTGRTPFEVKTIRAQVDGFALEFTKPVDWKAAEDPMSYDVTGFIYKYHSTYGSPPINQQQHRVRGVVVSDDRMKVQLVIEGLREGYIHEVNMPGVRSIDGSPLLHDVAYYTLNRIPGGSPTDLSGSLAPENAESGGTDAPFFRPQPKHQTTLPASWTGGPSVTLTIGTLPGLKFDIDAFEVFTNSRIALIFNNNDDMLHNLVVTAPGTVMDVAAAAMRLGLKGHEMDYVPASDDVLFHTGLLEPESAETIYFTAPTKPGTYPFVCTFPGHAVTMQGTMHVVAQ